MFASAHRRWRLASTLVALAVTAAACGSTETTSTPTLASTASPAESAAAEPAPTPDSIEPDTTSTDTTSTDTTGTGPNESEAVEDTEPTSPEPAVNLFPDLDVLNIADGATVNLAAELGGGDKATLLWFFAPH